MPSTPDSLFRALSTRLVELPRWSMMTTMAASIALARVPMGRPSWGVKPMEVSMDLPNFTEQVEAPLPRWRLAMRSSSMGGPAGRRPAR